MLEDSVIALLLWIVGLYYIFNTRKVQKAALFIQNKYPSAFPTRLPERSRYPAFLRVGAVICLIGAIFLTLRLIGQLSVR
jgi:hypothetical protein